MPSFDSDTLALWSGGRWTARPVAALTGFHFDTRQLQAGNVFVALQTEKRDGHEFLAAAQAAGASGALVARPTATVSLPQLVVRDPLTAFQAIAREHRRLFRGPVVAVSGSAGKTSTKDLLAVILGGAAAGVLATEGNLNNHLGVPLTLARLEPEKHTFAVIEAGISAPGEMGPLAAMIEPDVAIITLIAAAHTEELGGLDGVAQEKARLAAAIRARGVAIFGGATAEFPAFRALEVPTVCLRRVDRATSHGAPEGTVYFAVEHQAEETIVTLASGALPAGRFGLRRVSDGMAENAALAIHAALWLGVPEPVINERLAGWKPAKLRGEIRHVAGRLLYLDCYNANPASMTDALATFMAITPEEQPRLYVLGCMEELGSDAPAHHRRLGRELRLQPADQVLVIGSQAEEVRAGLLERGNFARQVRVVPSLEPLAAFVADWRGSIFVKGSRRYQLEKIIEGQASLPLSC